jgi:hypothetical protein
MTPAWKEGRESIAAARPTKAGNDNYNYNAIIRTELLRMKTAETSVEAVMPGLRSQQRL